MISFVTAKMPSSFMLFCIDDTDSGKIFIEMVSLVRLTQLFKQRVF
jgi:hypothetical protein